MEYKKRKENQAADALSRIYPLTDDAPDGTPTLQSLNIDQITYDDQHSLEVDRLINELESIDEAPPGYIEEY